jgi:streptogramin lyase
MVLALVSCGQSQAAKRVAFGSEGDRCKDVKVLYVDDNTGDELRCKEAKYRGPLTGPQKNAVFELAHQLARDGSLSKADKKRIRDFAANPTSVERTVRPDALAVGEGAVWVLGDDRLVRIDPAAGTAALQPVSLRDATELAVGEGAVWVLAAGEVVKVDPTTGERLGAAPLFVDTSLGEGRTNGLATGLGSVWVAWSDLDGPAYLTRLDPATLASKAQVKVADKPLGISRHLVVAGGSVWTAPFSAPYLGRFDPTTLRVAGMADFSSLAGSHEGVGGLAVSADALWVRVGVGTSLVRVDLRTGATTRVLDGSALPKKNGYAQFAQGVAVVGSTPWLVTSRALAEVDPVGHRLVRTVDLGLSAAATTGDVSALTAGLGMLWVMAGDEVLRADPTTGALTRIPMPSQQVAVR